jgi:HTH-type transcriptional regulator / antitoxin MqsA
MAPDTLGMDSNQRDQDHGQRAGRREAASAARPHGESLTDDACPQCGTMMEPRQSALSHPVHGEDIEVPDVRYLGCARCGEVVLSLDQATAWSKAAVQRYRDQHGLLASEEIRALRERFGLSQSELAALLRLDTDTIARWESDRQSQSAALDALLRLVRDVPVALSGSE